MENKCVECGICIGRKCLGVAPKGYEIICKGKKKMSLPQLRKIDK